MEKTCVKCGLVFVPETPRHSKKYCPECKSKWLLSQPVRGEPGYAKYRDSDARENQYDTRHGGNR